LQKLERSTQDWRSVADTLPLGPTRDVPAALGRYRIEAVVGRGGMGTVYRAFDERLRRVVALQVPRAELLAERGEEAVARFRPEARAAARVSHPNICSIHDVAEHVGLPFVVMEYVTGESLAARLARGRFEDVAEAVGVATQVADALAAV